VLQRVVKAEFQVLCAVDKQQLLNRKMHDLKIRKFKIMRNPFHLNSGRKMKNPETPACNTIGLKTFFDNQFHF
jgi:hypothetical protein